MRRYLRHVQPLVSAIRSPCKTKLPFADRSTRPNRPARWLPSQASLARPNHRAARQPHSPAIYAVSHSPAWPPPAGCALAAALGRVPLPDSALFADVDGSLLPQPPSSNEAAATDAAVAAALGALAEAVAQLDSPQLAALAAPCNPDAPHFGSASSEAGPFRIEELPPEDCSDRADPDLAARLVLAAALYSPCPPLPTPWAAPAASAAAAALLAQLAARLEVLLEPPQQLAPALAAALDAEQRLLLAVLPLALTRLRQVLVRSEAGAGKGSEPGEGGLCACMCFGSALPVGNCSRLSAP